MRKVLLVAGAVLLLAGCGGSGDDAGEKAATGSDQTVRSEKSAAAAAAEFSPGRWETKVALESVDVPGAPEGVKDAMVQQMGKTQTVLHCLTAEEAKKPDAKFFGADAGPGCKYEKYDNAAGTIDAVITCEKGQELERAHLTGTYTADSFAMAMEARAAAGPMGPMTMKMKVDSRRIGECDGTEKN